MLSPRRGLVMVSVMVPVMVLLTVTGFFVPSGLPTGHSADPAGEPAWSVEAADASAAIPGRSIEAPVGPGMGAPRATPPRDRHAASLSPAPGASGATRLSASFDGGRSSLGPWATERDARSGRTSAPSTAPPVLRIRVA